MIRSIYIDTSVFGGYYDPEFDTDTQKLFDKILKEKIKVFVSETVISELKGAPDNVNGFFKLLPNDIVIQLDNTDEAKTLARKYVEANVISEKYLTDCMHIAYATIYNADILVSWNFKHIVHIERRRGYNGVNIQNGYKTIDIVSPKEILNYE